MRNALRSQDSRRVISQPWRQFLLTRVTASLFLYFYPHFHVCANMYYFHILCIILYPPSEKLSIFAKYTFCYIGTGTRYWPPNDILLPFRKTHKDTKVVWEQSCGNVYCFFFFFNADDDVLYVEKKITFKDNCFLFLCLKFFKAFLAKWISIQLLRIRLGSYNSRHG